MARPLSCSLPLMVALALLASPFGPRARGTQYRDARALYAVFEPQPVGTQYLYTFLCLGRYIWPRGGDKYATANATLSFNVTYFDDTGRIPANDYKLSLVLRAKAFNRTTDPLTTVQLYRGSQKTTSGPLLVTFNGSWSYGPNNSWAVFSTRIDNTTKVTVPSLGVTLSKAFEYLTLYSGHHYIQINSKKRPSGSIRGQLVNVLGYPKAPGS